VIWKIWTKNSKTGRATRRRKEMIAIVEAIELEGTPIPIIPQRDEMHPVAGHNLIYSGSL